MSGLSLVIPVFNEEENLGPLLTTIRRVIPLVTDNYEIIFVDDASIDRSGCLLDREAAADTRVKVIHNGRNRTLGGSLKNGFARVSKEYVLYLDADMPFDFSLVPEVFALFLREKADIYSAYRMNRYKDGLRRLLLSIGYNGLIHFLFGVPVKDVNYAFKLFKADILRSEYLEAEGSFISAELLIRSHLAGRKLIQTAVEYQPRLKGKSRLSGFKVIVRILKELYVFYTGTFFWAILGGPAVRMIASSLSSLSCGEKFHLCARSRTCPYERVEGFVPSDARVTDLGCGSALFDCFLYLRSPARSIRGVDRQIRRIDSAQRLSRRAGIPLTLETADMFDCSLRESDCFLIIDALFLTTAQTVRAVYRRCFNALPKGGTLLVKELERRWGAKYAWSRVQEFFISRLLSMNGQTGRLSFFSRHEMITMLRAVGFVVEVHDLGYGYAYPHVLFVARKPYG